MLPGKREGVKNTVEDPRRHIGMFTVLHFRIYHVMLHYVAMFEVCVPLCYAEVK